MSLRERFRRAPAAPATSASAPLVESTESMSQVRNGQNGHGPLDEYQELKRRLHRELIGKLNMSSLEGMDENRRREQVESVARRLLGESDLRLGRSDEERLVQELRGARLRAARSRHPWTGLDRLP